MGYAECERLIELCVYCIAAVWCGCYTAAAAEPAVAEATECDAGWRRALNGSAVLGDGQMYRWFTLT